MLFELIFIFNWPLGMRKLLPIFHLIQVAFPFHFVINAPDFYNWHLNHSFALNIFNLEIIKRFRGLKYIKFQALQIIKAYLMVYSLV